MKHIINFEKSFNICSKEIPKEVVGFNFYSLNGEFIGKFSIEEKAYPKANYKLVLKLNDKEIEMNLTESLYLLDNGQYLLINDEGRYYRF